MNDYEPSQCDHCGKSGHLGGYFRCMGWVVCLNCCQGMSEEEYQRMLDERLAG